MPVPSWIVPAVTLCGSLIVSASNYAVQRWRYRADRTNASVDHLCNEINDAAKRASEYWFMEASPIAHQVELELVGLQDRIQQLIAAIQEQAPRLDLSASSEAVMDLFDAMTGGDFKVIDRKKDLTRAGRVYTTAAALNGQLRIAVARKSRWLW